MVLRSVHTGDDHIDAVLLPTCSLLNWEKHNFSLQENLDRKFRPFQQPCSPGFLVHSLSKVENAQGHHMHLFLFFLTSNKMCMKNPG